MDQREVEAALLLQNKLHQYQLEQYTKDELVKIYTAMNKVEKEILAGWGKTGLKTEFQQARAFTMLEEAKGMMAGIKVAAADSIAEALGKVSVDSAAAHSDILTFGGKAAHAYDVALSPDKMAAFWKTTPVGGNLLQDWVTRSFDKDTIERIQQEVAAGYFKGEGYKQMAKRLKEGFGMSRTQIDTLVRTYIQSANVEAMKRVYAKNKDLIKWVRWSAAYDTRTCLVCANLEGKNFPVDDHPPCPVHPRCRCALVPVTTIAKLGVTKEAAQEWVKKKRMEAGAIDPGVLKDPAFNPDGTLKKTMKSWIFGLPESEQLKFFGFTRLKLIQAGTVDFEDLVNMDTYKVKTLRELQGKVDLPVKAKVVSSEALILLTEKAEIAKVKEQLDSGQMQADLDSAAAKKEALIKLKVEYMEATIAGKSASKEAIDAWTLYSTKEERMALKQALKEKNGKA